MSKEGDLRHLGRPRMGGGGRREEGGKGRKEKEGRKREKEGRREEKRRKRELKGEGGRREERAGGGECPILSGGLCRGPGIVFGGVLT